jgi:predicted nucleic acid-binding protein
VKPAVFIDTGYFLALVNRRDKYHREAQEISKVIRPPFVTSQAVLMELGNALSRPPARTLGMGALQQIRMDSGIEVLTIDRELFAGAVALYRSRPDKSWGLTDCTSFLLMRQRSLTEVLTTDRHFEQAGFVSLLPV